MTQLVMLKHSLAMMIWTGTTNFMDSLNEVEDLYEVTGLGANK